MYTFEIHSIYEGHFYERLDKINRKAAKNGFDEFTAEVDRYRNDDNEMVSVIKVDCDLPQFNGWHLVAVIDIVSSRSSVESLVRVAPGQELPRRYTDVDGTQCDHCGIRHNRSHLFVIKNEQEDKFMQVGLTCLEDFLGKSAASLISSSWLIDFEEEFKDDDGEQGGRAAGDIDLIYYLQFVRLAIRAYGWLSRSKANEHEAPTASVAWDLMIDRKARQGAEREAADNPHKCEYKIEDALAWAQEQYGNDYLDNISKLARLEIVPRKYDGYAASILAAYERHLANEAEKALAQEQSEPAPEGRVEVTGTILNIKEKYSQYGMQLKAVIKTEGGWRLYVTLPKAISTANSGDKVQMTVAITPSDDDPTFAWGKRPSKAEIVERA